VWRLACRERAINLSYLINGIIGVALIVYLL
jgi:hypothetical protein